MFMFNYYMYYFYNKKLNLSLKIIITDIKLIIALKEGSNNCKALLFKDVTVKFISRHYMFKI